MSPSSEVSNLLQEQFRYTKKTILIFPLIHFIFLSQILLHWVVGASEPWPDNNTAIVSDLKSSPPEPLFYAKFSSQAQLTGIRGVLDDSVSSGNCLFFQILRPPHYCKMAFGCGRQLAAFLWKSGRRSPLIYLADSRSSSPKSPFGQPGGFWSRPSLDLTL